MKIFDNFFKSYSGISRLKMVQVPRRSSKETSLPYGSETLYRAKSPRPTPQEPSESSFFMAFLRAVIVLMLKILMKRMELVLSLCT